MKVWLWCDHTMWVVQVDHASETVVLTYNVGGEGGQCNKDNCEYQQ
jgi:hypothetical protein